MNKKKVVVRGVIAIVVIALAVGAGILIKRHLDGRTRTMDEVVTFDVSKIKSMTIMDGSNGEVAEVSSEHYQTVVDMLNEVVMPGVYQNKENVAYPMSYKVTITDDKGEKVITFYNLVCDVDGKEYNLKPDFDIENVLEDVYKKSGGVR